jgi:hypothetical protein
MFSRILEGEKILRLPGPRLPVAGLLVLLVAACSSAHRSPPPSPSPPPIDGEAACLKQLDQRHIVYERVKDWSTPEGCGIHGAVRVKQSATTWNRSALMTCGMASTVWNFETSVVQPAAQRFFGQPVSKMINLGAYSCRDERGGRPDRLSQHAFGQAIDISGFELADGTTITIRHDWRNQGAKSEFLHSVAQGACSVFKVVITPNRNAYHVDHLHLDIGPYKLCGY